MYRPDDVIKWLGRSGTIAASDHSHAVGHYLDFYSLRFAGVAHEMGYLDVAGENVCVQKFTLRVNRAGTAFVLHGYLDHSGLQHRLIERLLSIGMNVVLYDAPGHGLSSGARASIPSFSHYVNCLAACVSHYRHLPGPLSLFGHSMGGAVAMTYLLSRPAAFAKAVLLAPLVQPRGWRFIRAAHFVGRRFIKRQPRRFVKNTRDDDFYHFIREVDPLSPRSIPTRWVTSMFDWSGDFKRLAPVDTRVLVVQGTDDGTVDWRGNMSIIRRKFHHAKIHLVNDGKHHLMNDVESFREDAWRAIEPFLTGHP